MHIGPRAPARLSSRIASLDAAILRYLQGSALLLLRLSLGIVFVWFGVLKITGETPVSDLVADTVYWLDPSWFVPFLGFVEVVVGVGLLTGWGLRVILALFVLQMLGTFLVLFLQPDVTFQRSNPFLLTTEGEFVVKNLVLLSSGLVIASRLKPFDPTPTSRGR